MLVARTSSDLFIRCHRPFLLKKASVLVLKSLGKLWKLKMPCSRAWKVLEKRFLKWLWKVLDFVCKVLKMPQNGGSLVLYYTHDM